MANMGFQVPGTKSLKPKGDWQDSWKWGVVIALIITTLVFLFLHFFGGGILRAQAAGQVTSVSNQPRPRFESILDEYHQEETQGFQVWRDRETGQEFVCNKHFDSGSCFLTGRKW